MVEEMKSDPDSPRDILVKGYTRAIHVDTKEQRMHVTRTHLYPSEYRSSTFYGKKINIDYEKLNTERKKMISAMDEGQNRDDTMAKSVKVLVSKKPKQK
jgi:hypothetical protein